MNASLLVFVLFFLCFSSALNIQDVVLAAEEIDVSMGSPLVVPCLFITDSPIDTTKVKLEWGKTPENGAAFIPLVQFSHTNMRPVQRPIKRARLFVSLLQRGDCSLAINPATSDDTGIYELHISADGEEYLPIPKVQIKVSGGLGITPSTDTQTERKVETTIQTIPTTMNHWQNDELLRRVEVEYMFDEKSNKIKVLILTVGASAVGFLIAIGLGIYQLKAKLQRKKAKRMKNKTAQATVKLGMHLEKAPSSSSKGNTVPHKSTKKVTFQILESVSPSRSTWQPKPKLHKNPSTYIKMPQ